MKIEKIKKAGSKYKITLDNGVIIDTFENNLLFDKAIDNEFLIKLKMIQSIMIFIIKF